MPSYIMLVLKRKSNIWFRIRFIMITSTESADHFREEYTILDHVTCPQVSTAKPPSDWCFSCCFHPTVRSNQCIRLFSLPPLGGNFFIVPGVPELALCEVSRPKFEVLAESTNCSLRYSARKEVAGFPAVSAIMKLSLMERQAASKQVYLSCSLQIAPG